MNEVHSQEKFMDGLHSPEKFTNVIQLQENHQRSSVTDSALQQHATRLLAAPQGLTQRPGYLAAPERHSCPANASSNRLCRCSVLLLQPCSRKMTDAGWHLSR